MVTQFSWGSPLWMRNSLSAEPEYWLLSAVVVMKAKFFFGTESLLSVCRAIVNMVSHQTKVLFLVVFQHKSHNIRADEMEELPTISAIYCKLFYMFISELIALKQKGMYILHFLLLIIPIISRQFSCSAAVHTKFLQYILKHMLQHMLHVQLDSWNTDYFLLN